ncbi:Crp/Fnr family transcriptional regulator [Aquicoccus sp. G2-2]|uniref:Crp/Fnr family transcriptional regulator n=1 Tax=Aquicoccus sp. G2-2 TaxID=3092120 RepID=UPI002AE004E1|nr:Crp/Fnr family transcriptional regulator [Aquicoccus sp. G2-2]MEA1115240.1 Crp/Fnr family transcriptional regulator [Aquicoccus sp. G2-2]
MQTRCLSCPLRKMSLFAPISDEEVDFMQSFKSGELKVEAGTTLLMEGSNSPQLYTVLDGMGLRYKTLPDGGRQVINFIMPGDFIGLQAGVMQEMKHSAESTTAMTLCVFERKALWRLFQQHPERAFDLTWLAAVEESFLGESLAVLGQMSGLERVARTFARLHRRLRAMGAEQAGGVPFPYRQQDLADALGLSLVHTNKTLKKLREKQVVTWRDGAFVVPDYARLCEIAQMAPESAPSVRPLI